MSIPSSTVNFTGNVSSQEKAGETVSVKFYIANTIPDTLPPTLGQVVGTIVVTTDGSLAFSGKWSSTIQGQFIGIASIPADMYYKAADSNQILFFFDKIPRNLFLTFV
jgi:hypothetical protein